MNPKIDVITLGVSDLESARAFYEHGFGGVVRTEHQALGVSLGPDGSRLRRRFPSRGRASAFPGAISVGIGSRCGDHARRVRHRERAAGGVDRSPDACQELLKLVSRKQ